MREKIKLESSAGTGHFYTTTRTRNHERQVRDQEVRSRRPQARALQRDEARNRFGGSHKTRDAGFSFWPAASGFYRRQRRSYVGTPAT